MMCSAYHCHIYKIKENEMGEERGTAGRKKSLSRFNEKTWRKKTPEGPRHRWEISVKIYHK
jgi:hypothetical protein